MSLNIFTHDLSTEPIPDMWHMKHWLSHHKITIHNDGTQLSFDARLSAERDGYELDDSELSAKDTDNGQL
jgi:hypothetical protein